MRRALAVLTTALLLALVPVAAQADDQLGLSTDQVTWTPNLTSALFPDSTRWVPGDSRTASFWVRNQAADDGTLTISATRAPVGEGVDVLARVAGGPWTPLTPTATLAGGTLAPGATRQVDVRVVFDSAAGNATQARDFPATFRATLTQRPATGPGATDPDGDPDGDPDDNTVGAESDAATPGSLAATGATADPRLILAAVGALGTGGVLLLASRRRHREEETA